MNYNENNTSFFERIFVIAAMGLMLFGFVTACNAQTTKVKAVYDTVYCNQACILKYVQVPNQRTGKIKTYAVYKDAKNNISELIPISDSVYEYIQTCKQYGVDAHLGIKLKNNQISGIIRYKQTIRLR